MRKKWKSVRTCYSRELLRRKNKDPGISGRKQYQYFDQLRFLDVVPRNECTVNEEESENRAPSPTPVNVPIPVQRSVKKTITNAKRKAEKNSNEKTAKKRAVQYRDLELENEADRMFLLSLVPDLQKVSPEIKLQLKSDIINSILRAQQQDPLNGTQLYVADDSLNLSTAGGKLYNNVLFQKTPKELQQDSHDDNIYVSPTNLGMEFIKMETAESLSSLEDRGSLVGSEDCDDIFLT